MAGRALILYNRLSENPLPDELDVLDQVAVVEEALQKLGYEVRREWFNLDLSRAKEVIGSFAPDFVFNLVESVDGKGRLIYLAPALLEAMNMPFTGSGAQSIFLTSNKVLTKQFFRYSDIPTGEWFSTAEAELVAPDKRYIIKPLWEDGSVGITEEGVFHGNDPALPAAAAPLNPEDYFIEEYIHGREFNISMLGGPNGPQVMPPAEIRFIDFPEGKPHILGYKSKWVEDSFEYIHTVRSFDFPESDRPLLDRVSEISLRCWKEFNLKGYVRVDIRVDRDGKPFVLEINANPCISPDAGFYAACRKAGLEFTEVIERIIYDTKR
ncbi:MAG: D-alanine--D-alanine ligase family protein [Bacteroidota bacterium]